jgi:hypothetical protein
MDNKTLIEKADLALSDLATNGGLLLPEQSNAFIRKLIKSPTILRMARVVEMAAPSRKINKVQFGSRILRKAISATALSSADRSKPTTEQIQLDTKEVIAEVRLSYDVIEDNIERGGVGAMTDTGGTPTSGGFRDTIVALMAERAALDLEELGLLGDTSLTGTDDYLGLTHGFLRRTELYGNIADMGNQTVTKAVWKAGLKTMPDQYLRNRNSLMHFVSTDQETEYRDTLADRQTPGGDNVIAGMGPIYGYGSSIQSVPLMPEDKGLFSNPLNFIMGIQRQIMMEYDKDITARVYIIVLTARIDFQIEETTAAVLYKNLGTAA